MENEGGFADASGTVKDEGLRDAVVLGVVVENGFKERSWNDSPCFLSIHFQGINCLGDDEGFRGLHSEY